MWFDVDKRGLAKLLEGRDRSFILYELLQNSWDEEGVQNVELTLRPVPGRPRATLKITDDSPTGFRNLSHAWTLFAESYKKGDPTKRGKFNFGEKLVLALAVQATIKSTTGTVIFSEAGRTQSKRSTDEGSEVTLVLKMNRTQVNEILHAADLVIPPEGIVTRINQKELHRPTPLRVFETTLPTEHADPEGNLRPTRRKTSVEIFNPLTGDGGWLYEMGVPIVRTGDTWSVNIHQKVPLNLNRDNVTPAYLRKVRAAVINEMASNLGQDVASEPWVKDATGSKECQPRAFQTVMEKRFGEKRVMLDPSDPEAGMNAVSKGYTLVTGRQLAAGERENLRRFRKEGVDALQPAGRVFPTARPYSDDPNAKPTEVIPVSEWTERQKQVVAYARHVFELLVSKQHLNVSMVRTKNRFSAAYGKFRLDLNVRWLGKPFFEGTDLSSLERVNDLLIHEFGHHFSSNHLDDSYHDALTNLGAKLTGAALTGQLRPQDYGFTSE